MARTAQTGSCPWCGPSPVDLTRTRGSLTQHIFKVHVEKMARDLNSWPIAEKKKLNDACIQINKRFCLNCFKFRQMRNNSNHCYKCNDSFVAENSLLLQISGEAPTMMLIPIDETYQSKLKELYFGPVPSFLFIPKKVRDCVASLISVCIEAVVAENSVTTWLELLCICKILFCKCGLCSRCG